MGKEWAVRYLINIIRRNKPMTKTTFDLLMKCLRQLGLNSTEMRGVASHMNLIDENGAPWMEAITKVPWEFTREGGR
jgi:hypothetical protein